VIRWNRSGLSAKAARQSCPARLPGKAARHRRLSQSSPAVPSCTPEVARRDIHDPPHALRQQGLACSAIQRRTGFPRRSVAKWLEFETPPDHRRAALKPTSPWSFEEFLSWFWKDCTRTGSALLQMKRDRGCQGGLVDLQRLLAGWRRAERLAPATRTGSRRRIGQSGTGKRATRSPRSWRPRRASNPPGKTIARSGTEGWGLERRFPRLRNDEGTRPAVHRHVSCGGRANPLAAWTRDAIDTNLAPIMPLAQTRHRDIAAVRNPIEKQCSNGQAQGQINRLKTRKRVISARAGPELPSTRMLPLRNSD
jgi:hypothetical protein